MYFDLIQHEVRLDFSVKNHIDMLEWHGADVADLRARLHRLRDAAPPARPAISPEWQALERDVLRADAALATLEPWHLDDIMASRPAERIDRYDGSISDEDVADRIHGAWLGRIAGCMLGKPLEWFMKEEHSCPRVRHYLAGAGEYPPEDYVSIDTVMPYYRILEEKGLVRGPVERTAPGLPSLKENIRYACADDDTNYSLMTLRRLRDHGPAGGPDDVLAFLQFMQGPGSFASNAGLVLRNRLMGLDFPDAVRFMHTGRECVRSQIRIDPLAYVRPADPEAAAGLAWREAAATGSESGLYGAMWTGACIAAAFVESDPLTIVTRGLEQIPAECLLRREIDLVVEAWRHNRDDFSATFDEVDARWNRYAPNLAPPNCAIMAAALLHGGGDVTRTLGLCVSAGYDTDSSAANVGSIIGAAAGAAGIPSRWTEPLHDRLETSARIAGKDALCISEVARQTFEVWKRG